MKLLTQGRLDLSGVRSVECMERSVELKVQT